MVGLGVPRAEVGHRYVIALKWEPVRCTPGSDAEADRWPGMGSGAVLPVDDGVLCNGEFEGTFRPMGAIAEAERNGADHSFAWEVLEQCGDVPKTRLVAAMPDLSELAEALAPFCD